MAMSIDLSSVSHSFATSYELEDDGVECLPLATTEKAIFGRTKETKMLLEAYENLLKTKQLQTVIVHGKSGSGKTALVATLLGTVFDTNGYFVSGKYFQNEAVQEPFSAIMAAFSDLCDLVVQSEDFDEIKKQQIANAMSAHARLLVKVITNFASLTGVVNQGELEVSSIPKFKIACKAFLHTLACDDHPIVIFLDDIQWADEGSVALIQTLLQDAGLTNVMLILAYRDEEAKFVQEITKYARNPIDIALSNLDSGAIFDLVTSMVGGTQGDTRLLSELVASRTSGNPFHIATFLDTIEHERLLIYDSATKLWLFDVDEIQQAIMVSETLADLLTRKIGRISGDIKESLKVASLLGYHFDDSVLASIVGNILERNQFNIKNRDDERSDLSTSTASTSVVASLSEGVKEGFIEKTSNGYQFTHDKLQSAFQGLIGDAEENELHQLIGEVFLKERAQERSYIYKAAVHLNVVPISLDRQDRAKLAQINLDAAKYCVEISAFVKETIALQNGLDSLNDEERWSEEHSPLTFEIMEALARNQLIVGKFEACKQTTMEALCHSMEIDMKVRFQLIDVEVRLAGNELDDSLEMATRALDTLGIKMPRKAKARHILAKLLRVKWMLRNKTDEDILNLPLTHDPLAPSAIKLLMTMSSHYLLKEKQLAAVLCTLMAMELTLKIGLTLFSPGAFTFYGIVQLALGNLDRAYRFGKLALTMLDRMESSEAEFATTGFALTMLTFRREPFHDLVEPLRLTANSGFACGNMGYATYCIVQSYGISIHLGSDLARLEEDMHESYSNYSELGQDGLLLWLQPMFQYVLNMQLDVTNWDNISVLSGEVMNEQEFHNEALDTDGNLIMISHLRKARIACDFGQFELAESYFQSMSKTLGKDPVKFTTEVPPYYWDVARIHLGLYGSTGQHRHLKQGRKFMKLLQQLDKGGCLDAGARLVFLEAQKASVRKRPLRDAALRETYQHALNHLAKTDYFVLEGLLSENAGFDFAKRGLRREAKTYFERALRIYEHDWGARAKYNQLSETMLFWMEPDEVTGCPLGGAVLSGLCINVDPDQSQFC